MHDGFIQQISTQNPYSSQKCGCKGRDHGIASIVSASSSPTIVQHHIFRTDTDVAMMTAGESAILEEDFSSRHRTAKDLEHTPLPMPIDTSALSLLGYRSMCSDVTMLVASP